MQYRNPVIPGFYPDPSVCRRGRDYYLVTSSFEYFPGIPVFHSRDLVHWRQIGNCLTRGAQLRLDRAKSSDGLYAATIRYHDGLFYMITTNTTGNGHFYVTTDDPAAGWSDPIPVEGPGFDPDLFFDDDGSVYFSREDIGGYGIRSWKIDIRTGRLLGDESIIWPGLEDRLCEAPHIYKIGSWYYLFVAEGGTHFGHMVVAARSRNPLGPYEGCPHNPILTHRHLPDHPIQATGHADIVQDHDGRWWIYFLGVRTVGRRHHLGRETFLAPLDWTADGWPVVNRGKPIELEMEAELPEPVLMPREPEEDRFESPTLPPWYCFRGNPNPELWSLADPPGRLTLHGASEPLSSPLCPTFVGRRQRHFHCTAETELEFSPSREGEEAGLTVLQTHDSRYDLFVSRTDSAVTLSLRTTLRSAVEIPHRYPVESGPIVLAVSADRHAYRFSYRQNGRTVTLPAALPTAALSTEQAGGFTGVMFGMYASGNGARSNAPARFARFSYRGHETPAQEDR